MNTTVLQKRLRLLISILLAQLIFLGTIPLTSYGQILTDPLTVSGVVFNDANGNVLVNSGENFTSLPAPLYVYLVRNSTGVIDAAATVGTNGSYSLTVTTPSQNYTLFLSQDVYTLNTNTTTNRLTNIPPTGWVNSGENGSGNVGGDGFPNGILSVIVGTSSISNQNFGLIDRCSLFAPGNIDSDGDGISDRCDLDDDNDGIPDTDENACLTDMISSFPTGFLELKPSDFGITFNFTPQTNLNLTKDLSDKFGYEVNSGKVVVKITSANVHPFADAFYVRGDLPVTDWEIGGTLGVATAIEHGMEYFPNQRREIRLYNFETEVNVKNTTIATGNWETGSSNNLHYVKNNTNNQYIGANNGAALLSATLQPYTKNFGIFTNDADLDRWSTYFIRIATECDDDNNGIPNRLDLDSDGDGCADAVEGTGNFDKEDLNPNGSLSGAVSSNGIPVAAGTGQAIGTSQNSTQLAAACLVSISGTVWHDVNGDAVTNALEEGVNPETLYANLVNASNEVVASVEVGTNGEFEFAGVPASSTFSVILTNELKDTGNSLSASEALPDDWVHTGTNVGGVANTTNKTGVIANITTSGSDIDGIDFGIEQRPVAEDDSKSGYVGEPVTVISLDNDNDVDGTLVATSVSLIVPSGITGVTTTPDTDGDITEMTIPDEGTWTVDLTSGDITFTPEPGFTDNPTPIQYTVNDNAGVSSNPATVTITYTLPPTVSISGTVWHDVNGDAVTNATEVGVNPETLFANLVNASNEVVASVVVGANGEFEFAGVPASGTFSVILTNELKDTESSLSASDALPDNWVHTGTNVGGTANTTNKTGVIANITTSGSDITGIDFGIEQAPDSDDKTKVLASQPSAGTYISLDGSDAPLITGTDVEDDGYIGDGDIDLAKGIVITSLPTHGKLWYFGFGAPVVVSITDVTDGTIFKYPALFAVQLTAGNYTSTTFQYAYVDAAGVQDPTPASYTISWEQPLPVRLSSFNAKLEGSVTRLSWTTTEEVNADYFEIQHSINAKNWSSLDVVTAKGESNVKNDYTYDHVSSTGGVNYYRLKLVDKNGTFAISDIRSVVLKNRSVVSVYPNPASNSFSLKDIDLKTVKSVKVISLTGMTVWESKGAVSEAGINVNWGDGLYFVRVEKIDGTSDVLKLIVKR